MNLINKIDLFLNESKITKVKVNAEKFKSRKEVDDFISTLGMFDTPSEEIYDPETGEILMEPGETKNEILKNYKKTKKQRYKELDIEENIPTFNFRNISDEMEFNEYYNVLEKEISSLVDNPEEFDSLDYDTSWVIPVYISCKKMRTFTETDIYNIEKYIEFKNKNLHKFSPNISIILSSRLHKGMNKIKTMVNFH